VLREKLRAPAGKKKLRGHRSPPEWEPACLASAGQKAGTTPTSRGTSDEDGLWYVGERDVDMKASAFIARFHATASS
jgi:hypothetical protein